MSSSKGTFFMIAVCTVSIILLAALTAAVVMQPVVVEKPVVLSEKVSSSLLLGSSGGNGVALPKPAENSLVAVATASYSYGIDDGASRAKQDLTVYKPTVPSVDTWYWVGEVPDNRKGHPSMPSQGQVAIMVRASDPDALKAPVDWKCIWTNKRMISGSWTPYGPVPGYNDVKREFSFWVPVAPDGYVALGGVFVDSYNKPSGWFFDNFMCVNKKYCVEGKLSGDHYWYDHGSKADQDGSIWLIQPKDSTGVNAWTFWPSGSWNKPADTVYCLNRQYLSD